MKSVYIETTIPSYFYDTRLYLSVRAWRDSTRKWWTRHRPHFRLFTSRFVEAELRNAPAQKSRRCLAMISDIQRLPEPENLQEIVDAYVRNRLMPASEFGDAYHLALASLHKIDFLLTWNCRHLANANKIIHVTVINRRLGLSSPIITTPMTLFSEPGL